MKENMIYSEHYFTADHGIEGALAVDELYQHTNDIDPEKDEIVLPIYRMLAELVIATIVLKNGEILTGAARGEYNDDTRALAKAAALLCSTVG